MLRFVPLLVILLIPFVYADNDWRNGFPFLFVYDVLIQENNVIENNIVEDIENNKDTQNDVIELTDIIETQTIKEIPDDSITYFIYDIPEYANFQKNIVYESLNEWEALNPQLKFKEVKSIDEMDVQIIFLQDTGISPPIMPQSSDPDYIFDFIQIDIVEDGCIYSYDTIKDSIKHEIGHTLGLGHSSDVNNLMWGYDGIENFDSMGYVIPKVHPVELVCK